MTRKRRSFSPEFKQEAARLVLDQGYTIPQTSVSLGIGESAIPHLSARRPLSWPSFDVGVGHAYWGKSKISLRGASLLRDYDYLAQAFPVAVTV